MRVGLYGGSFNPVHDGHMQVAQTALVRLGLDRVWWLVSPGNPLKREQPAPMARRMARARAVMDDPRVVVSDLEARLGTRFTAATLERLLALYPGVRFVWLMGADNLAQFHRWDHWRWILTHVPVAVLARPGIDLKARVAPAARCFAAYRVPARGLAWRTPPAGCYLDVPKVDLSSSAIRARGEWQR